MKIFYRSTLPGFAAFLFMLMSCSPEYGAHFAPSKQAPSVAVQEQQSEAVAPLEADVPEDVPAVVEERATAAGAEKVITDIEVPAIAPEKTAITAKEQRKVLRQFKKKLKSMNDEEREAFKNQVVNQLKEQQKGMNLSAADNASEQDTARGAVSLALLIVLAIILPPLAVFLHQGEINTKFWISLVLSLLFLVPGIIYAFLVIFDAV